MKIYHEMIQYVVDQIDNSTLRYQEFAVAIVLAHAYGLSRDVVLADIQCEKSIREDKRKAQRKAENRSANESRRLKNLSR